ncbi:MAG TPA: hypothetical protein VHD63_15490, partial [Ktedonobacteraceae bacterium]|nr:hypothetical protein [Ktedonobacteraceae bacterium]
LHSTIPLMLAFVNRVQKEGVGRNQRLRPPQKHWGGLIFPWEWGGETRLAVLETLGMTDTKEGPGRNQRLGPPQKHQG